MFQKSEDIKFQQYHFDGHTIHMIICEAMVDYQLLNEMIVPRVGYYCSHLTDELFEQQTLSHLYIPQLKKVENKEEAILLAYTGFVLILFEEESILFSSNIQKKPNRNPEETRTEITVKGPRDNFIEDLSVNIALIRKRMPTNSLCVEKFEVGKRTKTSVGLLYLDDVVNKDTLNELKNQISKIDKDILISGDEFMDHINKASPLFPRHEYTGRADYAIQALVRGRFILFVDGTAYGMITPANLFLLLKTSEDNEYPSIFGSIERMMRIIGILISIFLPAFWLALTTFHQNQVPFQLLATVVQANTGLPLPTALEMLLMLGMFELFREAGLRLPLVLGGTIGVVGGLIIGDAVIQAGMTSPAMVVIMATSTIASFTLVNQSVVTAVSVLRIFVITLTAFLGLFGFFVSFYFIIVYLSKIKIFGVPYMNLAIDLSWDNVTKTLFRLPTKAYNTRPTMLKTKDSTRSKKGKKNE